MTFDKLKEIMKGESHTAHNQECGALLGLNLIAKYLPNSGVEAATHDEIYACGVDEIIKAGITEDDARKLRSWGWMIDEDSLAKFV